MKMNMGEWYKIEECRRMAIQRNPIKKWLDEQRYYGDVHRDKKKYHRHSPNHHEFDDEISLTLEEREKENE